MEIGDKLLLHRHEFPAHESETPDEFMSITITKVRTDVPGMWGSGKYRGYEAVSETGKTLRLWWSSYPDDAMCPTRSWYVQDFVPDGEPRVWYDVTQVGFIEKISQRPLFVDKYSFISYCGLHRRLFYNTPGESEFKGKCWECVTDNKNANRAERDRPKAWLGWY